ncbi:MAG: hypothetical protein NVS9B3_10320 [Gemmatimonadaceae bacterium]
MLLPRLLRSISSAFAAALVAACSDPVAAPTARQSLAASRHDAARATEGSTEALEYHAADFVVTAAGGTFSVAGIRVFFPPNAVCDPRTAGYGPATWDAPCAVLTAPIAIHADVRTRGGPSASTWIQFTPDLRFAPVALGRPNVSITMKLPGRTPDRSSSPRILWLPSPGAMPIDEGEDDPALRTALLPDGFTSRRIKHFSGYVISTGHDGAPPVP